MSEGLVARDGDVEIKVWVVPGAARTEIKGMHGDAVRIRVAQPPERGKANRAVLALLRRRLARDVELTAGTSSRSKRFVVRDVPIEAVRRALGL